MRVTGLKRRSFALRYLTLLGGEVASKVCVLVAFGYLARILGPRELGVVELALSATVLFVLAAEAGLGPYAARLVEAAPERAAQLLPRAGLLRLLLGTAAYVFLLAISRSWDTPAAGVLAVFGLTVLMTPLNTPWLFQGLRQMQWVAAGSFLRYATFAVLVLLMVRRESQAFDVALTEIGGAAALAVFNAIVIWRVLAIRLDWRGVWRGARDLFGETWTLGASDLTWAAMWYAPTIVLGWIMSERTEQAAWLAAAVRIVMSLHTFVFLYFFNMVPNLSQELRAGVESWRALIQRSLSISMWAACFVALTGTFAAPMLMTTLFGAAYASAALPFQIVVWMIPVAWLSGHFRFSLIVAGRQRLEFSAALIASLATVGLAAVGASMYGAPGAAAALLSGGLINAVAAWAAMSRTVGTVPLRAAAPALLSCMAAALLAIALGAAAGAVVGAVAACLGYAAIAVSRPDVARLMTVSSGSLLSRRVPRQSAGETSPEPRPGPAEPPRA